MAGRGRMPLDPPGKLGPHRLELCDLGVDLGHAGAQQGSLWPQGHRPWSQMVSSSAISRSRRPSRWALLMNRSRSTASCWYWR
jgi:hypothetical protein